PILRGAERHAQDDPRMPVEGAGRPVASGVPDLDRSVLAARGEPTPVVAEGHAQHTVAVSREVGNVLAAGIVGRVTKIRITDFDGPVTARRRDVPRTVSPPGVGNAINGGDVVREERVDSGVFFSLLLGQKPEPHPGVVTPRYELVLVRKGDTVDGP